MVYFNSGVDDSWSDRLHFDSKVISDFDRAASSAYGKILSQQDSLLKSKKKSSKFDLSSWTKRTEGGLADEDRVFVAKIYGQASSLFEFGLGESTYIANHVGVPRYAGIDSDVEWVNNARKQVAPNFRFYYGDIGNTVQWGRPEDPKLTKNVWQYQVAPLESELQPFDVYMVDGRWRVPCVFLSFLHASARGAKWDDTLVLLHDCYRPDKITADPHPYHLKEREYQAVDEVFELVGHSGHSLCAYKRKNDTTDAMLLEHYEKHKETVG